MSDEARLQKLETIKAAGVLPYAERYERSHTLAEAREVAAEHARDNVQVNSVGTNFMDFPEFIRANGLEGNPERRAKVEAAVPMGRLGQMDEFANFCAVLLDGTSRFQTGQFFSYSGGWSS